MSKIITVQEGQTVIDIAVQYCGNVDRMIDIVNANKMIGIDDVTGETYNMAEALIVGLPLKIEDEWIERNNKITENLATAK